MNGCSTLLRSQNVFRCFGRTVFRWIGNPVNTTKTIEGMNMKKVESFRELEVYQAAFRVQQSIFVCSKRWPKVEDYSLTDQIRRSSRSIGANLAESWAKRRYPAHFLSKLTDADGELQETFHWLDTARACDYFTFEAHKSLTEELVVVGRQLGSMINCHESFCF
jgi:four helix bundle protein